MKTFFALLLSALISFATFANENQTAMYKQNGCGALMEDLVKFHLLKNPNALSPFGYMELYREEIESLTFDFVDDLDQGSWDIQRRVRFKMKIDADSRRPMEEGVLTVLTRGDLFCDEEKLESIESFQLIWSI